MEDLVGRKYRHGFVTDIESDTVPPGLDEDVIRLISRKKEEPQFMLDWRLKSFRHWQTMHEPDWAKLQHRPDRLPGHLVLLRTEAGRECAEEPRGSRPETARDLRQARHSAARACRASGRRRRRRVRQRIRRHDVPRETRRRRRHFLPVLGRRARLPGTDRGISRQRRALSRQLLRHAELGRLQRRLVRLHPEGRALPDGAVDVFPDQRSQDRAIRAHADHRGRRQLRQLPRGLHGTDARREPAACGRRGTGGAGRRGDQVLDGAELVPGRRGRPRRHLQLRHQARGLPRRQLQGFVDPGRSRVGRHLEVSELRTARRELRRRILFGRGDEQSAAGRHRHEDDSHRPQLTQHHRIERHFRRPRATVLPRTRQGVPDGRRMPATTRNATRC